MLLYYKKVICLCIVNSCKSEVFKVMYPYLALDDETEFVRSEMLEDNTVKVYIEKPNEKDCFHCASCYLPKYEWKDVFGFDENEIKKYQTIIDNNAHLIIELSQNGGFDHASGF